MIAVIFEVQPAEGRRQDYLDLATALKPELEQADGFLSIERFESLVEPGKVLSLSFWRDEPEYADAVAAQLQKNKAPATRLNFLITLKNIS